MNKKKTFPKKKAAVNTGVLEAVKDTETIVATPVEEDFKIPPMPKSNNNLNRNPFGRDSNEKPSIYQLLKGRKKGRDGKFSYPVVYMIRAEDVIYDPIKQVNRKIRYIPGETSIYEDEQKKGAKVKSPITFNEGFITVGFQNPTLKQYLDICN